MIIINTIVSVIFGYTFYWTVKGIWELCDTGRVKVPCDKDDPDRSFHYSYKYMSKNELISDKKRMWLGIAMTIQAIFWGHFIGII